MLLSQKHCNICFLLGLALQWQKINLNRSGPGNRILSGGWGRGIDSGSTIIVISSVLSLNLEFIYTKQLVIYLKTEPLPLHQIMLCRCLPPTPCVCACVRVCVCRVKVQVIPPRGAGVTVVAISTGQYDWLE